MVLIQALVAALFRSLGKLVNMAFGWATALLFGKVPDDRQVYLSAISFGSVAWLVAALGVAVPQVGTWLLGFVELPEWVDQTWVRLAMLAAALVLPAVVGVASIFMRDPEDRPHDAAGRAKAVVKGYPYTLGMALTLVVMTVFAPVMKLRSLVKRWTTAHVPVFVEPADYLTVVGDIQEALRQGGLETQRQQASRMLRLPTKVLTAFAGGAVQNLVADELTTLVSDNVEVLLHPSDMVISGRELDAARAHAIITEQLTFTKAYMTWTKEAHEFEDRLRAIWEEVQQRSESLAPAAALAKLRDIERELRTQELEYEEWSVLFREKMQVERGLLRVMAGITAQPEEPDQEQAAGAGESAPGGDAPLAPAPAPRVAGSGRERRRGHLRLLPGRHRPDTGPGRDRPDAGDNGTHAMDRVKPTEQLGSLGAWVGAVLGGALGLVQAFRSRTSTAGPSRAGRKGSRRSA